MNPAVDQLTPAAVEKPHVASRVRPVPPVRPASPKPLLPIAVGMIVGISFDYFARFPIVLPLGIFTLSLGFAFVPGSIRWLTARSRLRLTDSRRLLIAIVLASIGLGMLRHTLSSRYFSGDDIALLAPPSPAIVSLTGRVATAPRIIEPDPAVPRAYPAPPRTRLVIDLESIDGPAGPAPASGRLPVTIKEPMLGLDIGCRIRVTGWLHRFRPPQNPGAYDWAAHFARQGIYVALSTDHADAVQVISAAPAGSMARLLSRTRLHLLGYLVNTAFPDDDENAGVIAAMVLGQRSIVSKGLNDAFLRTGSVHFLAASGMHVGWLALVGWSLARLLGLHYRRAAPLVAFLIILFVLVAEPQPSILRAGIIGVLACLAIYLRGKHHPTNALALAAIILLMIDPMDLFNPGFQLSFIATIGIFQVFPVFSNALSRFISTGLKSPSIGRLFIVDLSYTAPEPVHISDDDVLKRVLPTWLYRITRMIALAFSLALAEWLITAPLACFHFNTFAPWGALGTLLVAPFAMLSASLGFITVLAGVLFPSLGQLLGPILGWAVSLMVHVVNMLARLPGTLLDGRSPSLAWILCIYALIGAWSFSRGAAEPRHRRRLFGVALALVAWWWIAPFARITRGDALRVWMLAVGDGTATVIELPNGRTLLYDFGTRSGFDAAVVATDFFGDRGIRTIDAAFVSHANFDHYGAMAPIARQIQIHEFVVNDQFVPAAADPSAPNRFLASIGELGIPVTQTQGDASFDYCPGVQIESIWPPARGVATIPDENDASTVLRLTYQGRSILLTGDIAELAMANLLNEHHASDGRLLRADALALPHHGSVVTNTRAFINAVDPQIAVRSAGQRRDITVNGIESIVGPARRYFNTADDGCIVITIQDGEISARRAMAPD